MCQVTIFSPSCQEILQALNKVSNTETILRGTYRRRGESYSLENVKQANFPNAKLYSTISTGSQLCPSYMVASINMLEPDGNRRATRQEWTFHLPAPLYPHWPSTSSLIVFLQTRRFMACPSSTLLTAPEPCLLRRHVTSDSHWRLGRFCICHHDPSVTCQLIP